MISRSVYLIDRENMLLCAVCTLPTCMKLGKLETQTLEKYKNVAGANSLKSDLTFAFGLCPAVCLPGLIVVMLTLT